MEEIAFQFQPVIVVGAARSGTNLLRDMLTKISAAGTWPCDEINYIWRHHNATVPHDELTQQHARPVVRRYIRRMFQKQARRGNCRYLIEKTCANSLRIEFVDAVIPEAKYVFLVRDGRDVVASALQRWAAPLEVGYLMRKARFVPPSDFLLYARKYMANRIYRLFSAQQRLSTWGPRFVGMRGMLAMRTLEEVCASQWARSVALAAAALEQLDANRVIRLKYETLVEQPQHELTRILDFLGIDAGANKVRRAISHVSPRSIGKWKTSLSSDAIARVTPIVAPQLAALGYDSNAVTECDLLTAAN